MIRYGAALLASLILATAPTSTRAQGTTDLDITFENSSAGHQLAGTLSIPAGPSRAAVILISGSGAQDRDSTLFGHRPHKTISAHLVQKGFTVLRYDDRGVGQSTGDPSGTMLDNAADAEAALDFLRARSGFDSQSIGYLGHSEGGTLAAMIAAKRPDVAFVISLAGSTIPGHAVLRGQTRAQRRAAGQPASQIDQNETILDQVISAATREPFSPEDLSETIQAIADQIGEKDQWVELQTGFFGEAWTRHFLTYDPRSAFSRVKAPMLLLFGEKDLQVLADENAATARTALTHHKQADVKILPGHNHLFQHAQTGLPAEYAQIAEPISAEALEIISDWLINTVK